MHCFAQSDRGSVRKENQDRAACAHIRRRGCTIAVVCDGMGGAAGGKLASDLAASMFLADFRREMQAGIAVEPAMRHACDAANRAVYDRACADPDLHGMGTTIVGGVIKSGGSGYIINVGDSRAYYISRKNDAITQITRDHSLVEELVEFGAITKEQARVHPQRNVITRALGSEASVDADYYDFSLQNGDFLLMCSDGLSNMVSDLEMLEYAKEYPEPELLCRALMSKALKRGAKDNVTVLAVMK